jgi:hypothetical protein
MPSEEAENALQGLWAEKFGRRKNGFVMFPARLFD